MFRLAHDGKGLKIRINSLSVSSVSTSIQESLPPSVARLEYIRKALPQELKESAGDKDHVSYS
jgi:hypothetical protein